MPVNSPKIEKSGVALIKTRSKGVKCVCVCLYLADKQHEHESSWDFFGLSL